MAVDLVRRVLVGIGRQGGSTGLQSFFCPFSPLALSHPVESLFLHIAFGVGEVVIP